MYISVGMVNVYDIHGDVVSEFQIHSEIGIQLLECHFWGNGIVSISSRMELFVAEVHFSLHDHL